MHFYCALRVFTCFLGVLVASSCYSGVSRDLHASVVVDYLRSPGVDADAVYADPGRSLGPPDGRTVALGVGAALSLRFFREIADGPGPDLRVIELGPDGAKARIAVSTDGETFFEYPHLANSGQATLFEFSEFGLKKVKTVRIRGIDNEGDDPGFDLDALEALH